MRSTSITPVSLSTFSMAEYLNGIYETNTEHSFYFTNGNEKDQYATKLVSLITEAIEHRKELRRTEDDQYNACYRIMIHDYGLSINTDALFMPAKSKKNNRNNRKSPNPSPVKLNKKPRIAEMGTSSRFSSHTIDPGMRN
ncbi:hypothetical protein TNCT_223501 [Trichonephila clavata]|uniref:Uncharacterized protein n=1 Tax=Trichonephila clavata TaxID=2740835 RepID=A0A8X6LMI1_TRICU|nr:hypothetical protein TNCT_223501 [Trichonephila clavata]